MSGRGEELPYCNMIWFLVVAEMAKRKFGVKYWVASKN